MITVAADDGHFLNISFSDSHQLTDVQVLI